jgi:prevent-host-death family protein
MAEEEGMGAVKKVTIAEFEASPRAALRRARAGAVVEVVSRGRIVARLVPAHEVEDPVARAYADAPVDDEPLTRDDLNAIAEARAEIAAGGGVPHERVKEMFGL